ncbi:MULTISPECIES: sirohydrochlorin chelatase [Cobetia]|jgi:sirohydrochlorin cobaltochelatase|uniref:sirohydrochlorin chelatase n=1 Tax=Cobetia TaxID=204286 RepID=UPI0020C7C5FF|nr:MULTISPECIES: CbiX/SirB N-terminal domain-containing protein [Cobetia]MDH2292772.1 CbiX/SirB N-terminal domain-containing protein [Cobetia sp. 10Alg 146]
MSKMEHQDDALILLAHGSRDPRWREPFEALETSLASRLKRPTRLAYMELCDPLLTDTIDALAADGAARIDILPLFFAAGRHLREDVPAMLETSRQQHPDCPITLLDPVGAHPAFVEALIEIVEQQDNA